MPTPDISDTWAGDRCPDCGRPVLPTGIYAMPIDGFCECVFWR